MVHLVGKLFATANFIVSRYNKTIVARCDWGPWVLYTLGGSPRVPFAPLGVLLQNAMDHVTARNICIMYMYIQCICVCLLVHHLLKIQGSPHCGFVWALCPSKILKIPSATIQKCSALAEKFKK